MYRAPIDEIAFTLKDVCGLSDLQATEAFSELGDDLVAAILTEAGPVRAEEIAPLNSVADKHGTPLSDGEVTTPPGWRECYHGWIEGGWNGLTANPEAGGQGLPVMLSAAALEMWNSGSMAFAIGPTLTIGAVEALEKHASEELKATYLEKLVSGEWMGTMNLTEPQAGSDLNALKARAERNGR
jgi:acyl-CoA dehydrogenase